MSAATLSNAVQANPGQRLASRSMTLRRRRSTSDRLTTKASCTVGRMGRSRWLLHTLRVGRAEGERATRRQSQLDRLMGPTPRGGSCFVGAERAVLELVVRASARLSAVHAGANIRREWAASSAGRAPRSQRGGREFEPPAVHQNAWQMRQLRLPLFAVRRFVDSLWTS